MTSSLITCEIDSGLCTLTLNRPQKRNALNLETFRQLDAYLATIDVENVGCVLLTANGPSFCAGHDLDDLVVGKEEADTARYEGAVIERLANLPVPVVAAVRGHCYTGGLELVLAADIIISTETASFADTHAKWDLVPMWGLTQRLPRRIGPAKAREMIFSARTYSGVEAVALGLVNQALPEDGFDEAVKGICSDVLANSWRSARAMKKLLLDTESLPLDKGLVWDLQHTEGHGPEFKSRLETLFRK